MTTATAPADTTASDQQAEPAPTVTPPPAPGAASTTDDDALASYNARLAEYDKALDELRSAVERQRTDAAAAKAEVARLLGDVRDRELDKARVKPECRRFVPADLDLSTEAGKAELEKLRADHPYFFVSDATPATPVMPTVKIPADNAWGLTEATVHELVRAAGVRR